jgi:hypothetical protein
MNRPFSFRESETAATQVVRRPRASDAIGESLRQVFEPADANDEMRSLLARLERIA